MRTAVSVIIPVYNAAATLPRCLQAVNGSEYRDFECLVADDGSSDNSRELAVEGGARVFCRESRRGPASARNLAAAVARGEILLFIDADVCIEPDTLTKVANAFAANAQLDALIGSYDDSPAAPNFMSQYKNLMHCFFHQQAKPQASTFWTGCGAIRRQVFLASGGFDENYARPCIEDIELGSRMLRSERTIELRPSLTVKHLKHWTLLEVLKSDIRDRAIPWTLLMLRERQIPNDLNTQWSQRFSVALAYTAVLSAIPFWPASVAAVAIVIAMNQQFYQFLIRRRGLRFGFRAAPLHFLYFLYSGAAFAAAFGIWSGRQCFRMFNPNKSIPLPREGTAFEPAEEPEAALILSSMISHAPPVKSSSATNGS